jgi:hypothetical protein
LSVLQNPEELKVLVLGIFVVLRPPVMCGTTMAVHTPPRELVVFGRTENAGAYRDCGGRAARARGAIAAKL